MGDPANVPSPPTSKSAPVQISRNTNFKTVAKGVKVTYELANVDKTRAQSGPYVGEEITALQWRWMVVYHYRDDDGEESESWTKLKDDAGRSTTPTLDTHFTFKWNKVGRHVVRCIPTNRSTGKFTTPVLDMEQQVEELDAILAKQMVQARAHGLFYPYDELFTNWKYVLLVQKIGQQMADKMSARAKVEHQQKLDEYVRVQRKLKALLDKYGDKDRIWPMRAVYLAEDSMEQQELRIFVAQPAAHTDRVYVVDWTNLDEKQLHGEYEGKVPSEWKGRTGAAMLEAAVKDAIDTWEKKNDYWPGGVRYEFDHKLDGGSKVSVSGNFKTGQTSFTEDLISWLKKIAEGALALALIVSGVFAAEGGWLLVTELVAQATAMATGGAAAVLSIHHRHAKGKGNLMDDAIDALDVVANVLGLGARAGKSIVWKAGRTMEMELTAGQKTVRMLFVGEAWASGFNGILIGGNFIIEYNKIMDSTVMSPDEKARALLGMIKGAVQNKLLHALNHKTATTKEKADWNQLMEKTDKPLVFEKPRPKAGAGDRSDGVPKRVDDAPTRRPGQSDGVPKPINDPKPLRPGQSDGVPHPVDDKPTSPTKKTPADGVPKKPADDAPTAPIKGKPAFTGNTKDGQKKVTVVNRQKRQTPAGIPTREIPATKQPAGPLTNGIPHEAMRDGKYLVLGIYGKQPPMQEWVVASGAKDAKVVTQYDNPPVYNKGQANQVKDNPPEGFYTDMKKMSVAVIKDAAKHEGRAILVDMNGINIDAAIKPGVNPAIYKDKITSYELRYLRDNWDSFSPPPRFFLDGKEVKRPW